MIAKKLRYNSRARKAFVEICVSKEAAILDNLPPDEVHPTHPLKPHNFPRAVATRWNSTYLQVKAALRLKDVMCVPSLSAIDFCFANILAFSVN
jgi:hypothetical protein